MLKGKEAKNTSPAQPMHDDTALDLIELANDDTTVIAPSELLDDAGLNIESEGTVPQEQPVDHPVEPTQQTTVAPTQPTVTTRSGRTVRPPSRMNDYELSFYVPWDVFHDESNDLLDGMDDPIAFAVSNNPDVMHIGEALVAPDAAQFKQAMADEVESHTEHDHWEIVDRSTLDADTKVLPAVWAFRRKRRIATQEVYKWKARLNIHGGHQEHGINYWETYAPVVGWPTIRLFLILMTLNQWESRQVDFVLAFPQADVECPLFMEIPQGFNFKGSRKKQCLKIRKNLYGQKQAGRVWNTYLHDGLLARGFVQSQVDMCVYYRGPVALMIYTDDGIFIGPTQGHIDECYDLLSKEFTDENGVTHRAFRMTVEGELADYLGVKIQQLPNGTIKLYQPHLIKQILEDMGFNERTTVKSTPASTAAKISRDLHGPAFDEAWSYRSVIGKLNFLEKSTRPDISYAVHQCARFSNDPRASHATAVKRIAKYLLGTANKGVILNPRDHSFDCFVDADFVGNWDRVNAHVDPSTAKSRTGYILFYGGCPLEWASKLQREVALSTTEAEYNTMSESLRSVIFLMQLVEEIGGQGWEVVKTPPTVHCKVYEDNSGALEMSRLPKMRPRTKHLCVKLHHFRESVRQGKITIHKIPSVYQLADIATKPQPEKLFLAQRESILQWQSEFMTTDELKTELPDKQLRACEIMEQSTLLCKQADETKALSKNNLQPASQFTSFGD